MTNLFDFATKELSQDAFIMWLVSNYNEPKDLALRDSALSFISFLTDNKIDKKTLENSIIKISSQVNHMDVSIDIYKDKGSKIHDVIVVEDKVGSSEHRQLKAYNDAIEGWSNIGTVYKVFYKTRKITDNDRKGIKEANKDTKTGEWRLYDTEKIWKFFKDQDKSNSQVLNDYVDYIKGIKEALDYISRDNIEDWKSYHWEGFATKVLGKYDNPKSPHEEYVWVDSYQGRYVSICYQRCFPNTKDAAAIEIFVRDTNCMSAVFHHAFYDGEGERRKWNPKECKYSNIEEKEELHDKLRKYVDGLRKTEEFKILNLTKKDAKKCFGRISSGSVKINNKEDAEKLVKQWIKLFIKVVDGFRE